MKHNGRLKAEQEIQKRLKEALQKRAYQLPAAHDNRNLPNRRVVSRIERPKPPDTPRQLTFRPFSPLTGSFKHSGDLGDLYYSLPVIRYLGGGALHLCHMGLKGKKPDGTPTGFSSELINFCMPLLDAQPYISNSCFYSPRQRAAVDLDLFRKIGPAGGNLCSRILSTFSVPFEETQTPWIHCEAKRLARTIFCRSFRYRNQETEYKALLQEHRGSALFLGLPDEHRDFEERFGKIDFYRVKDALEMAEIINGAEIFIGNQSSPLALAVGMHKPFIQEAWHRGADCKFDIPHSRYMDHE